MPASVVPLKVHLFIREGGDLVESGRRVQSVVDQVSCNCN